MFIVRNIPTEQCVTAGHVIGLLQKYVDDACWTRASSYYFYEGNESMRVRDFEGPNQETWSAFEVAMTIGLHYSYRLVIVPKHESHIAQKLAEAYLL